MANDQWWLRPGQEEHRCTQRTKTGQCRGLKVTSSDAERFCRRCARQKGIKVRPALYSTERPFSRVKSSVVRCP